MQSFEHVDGLPPGTLNEHRWEAVLAAAEEVFLERGYEGTTVEEIAGRLGMVKGSLYYYIRRKPDLLYHVLCRANVAHLQELQSDSGVMTGDAESRLGHFLRRFMSQMDRERPWPRDFERDYFLSAEQLASLNAIRREIQLVLRSIITQGIDEGTFAATIDPSVATNSIMTMLTATTRWFEPSGRRSFHDVVAWYEEFVLNGLRPRT